MNAVTVERLSKRYRVSAEEAKPDEKTGFIHLFRRSQLVAVPNVTREIWALRDVSFEVERGTILGLIGRSKAGKSTLLKILGRLTLPTEGRATLRGHVISLRDFTAKMVPDLSGRDNLVLSAGFYGFTEDDILQRLDTIVEFAGVPDVIDRPVNRYIGDTYQRLAFSMALQLDADVLLIDDLVTEGDVKFQERCLVRLQELAAAGTTILLASHDLPTINRLCQRALVLEDGRIVGDDKPSACITLFERTTMQVTAKQRQKLTSKSSRNDQGEIVATKIISEPDPDDVREISVSRHIDLATVVRVTGENVTLRVCFTFSTRGMQALRLAQPRLLEVSEPGAYMVIVRVPAYLLAETLYDVETSAIITQDGAASELTYPSACVFEVVDTDGDNLPSAPIEDWEPPAGHTIPQWQIAAWQDSVTV